MENKTINVLLIENNPEDAAAIKLRLAGSPAAKFEVTTAVTLKDGLERLSGEKRPDLVLSDLLLPDAKGLEGVSWILRQAAHIPLVVLGSADDEALAIKAVQAGAQDYLVKENLESSNIERTLYYAIERTRMQRELEQKVREVCTVQANLTKILEKNADAIIVVGADRRIIFTNPAVETLLGRRRNKELVGRNFEYPLDGVKATEIEIARPDGTTVIAEMRVVDITWEGGPAYLASLRDVTARKTAEKSLRESEEKFFKAFRCSLEVIVISRLSDSTMLDVNDTFLRLTGFTREECLGRKFADIGWAFRGDRAMMVKKLQEQGSVRNEEYAFRMKSGEIRTWLFSAETVAINNECCVLAVMTDFTERKEVEEALRFSDAAFQSIHESVIATDMSFVITHWNKISEDIYGIKASQAIGRNLLDVIEIVENSPRENERRFKALEANGYYQEEQLHRTRFGEVWVDVKMQAIDDGKKRSGWVALATVITQRKQAEEALKRSEEKYRELINNSIDGIVATDSNMRVLVWNPGAEKIFGFQEKEMLGQIFFRIVPEQHHAGIVRGFTQLKKYDFNRFHNKIIETVALHKAGHEVPVEMSISIRKTPDNYVLTSIVRDISGRKQPEVSLLKIEPVKSGLLANQA
jgi:PAS domain S-box-containing protein